MSSFWNQLQKPISVLAPMEDVTDTVFRKLVAECGAPDVFYTEFTSADGLFSAGRQGVIHRLQFTDMEMPLVAQIWGVHPENIYQAAKLLDEMGFDGVDINMGCPVAKIVKKGACSALIENPSLSREIICAAREGAGSLPLSVKTRLGFQYRQTEEWTSFLLEQKLDALIVHGRVAKHQSKYPADWGEIAKVAALRDQMQVPTLILGNGDVANLADLDRRCAESGVDGAMVGRAIFQDLFFFNRDEGNVPLRERSALERLKLYLRHVELFRETWEGQREFGILKKFAKVYASDFRGASQLRMQLVESRTLDELLGHLQDWMAGASSDKVQSESFESMR